MKSKKTVFITLLCLTMALLLLNNSISHAAVEDSFVVHYRVLHSNDDGQAVTGRLLLEIANITGDTATNMVLSVDFPSHSWIVDGPIQAGDFLPGSIKFVETDFLLRETNESGKEGINWKIEYQDSGGRKQEALVKGIEMKPE